MPRVETKLKLSDKKFKRRVGTTKQVFFSMLYILHIAHDQRHELSGKPLTLTIGE